MSDLIYREDAKDYVRHAHSKGIDPIAYLDEVPAANFRPIVQKQQDKAKDAIKYYKTQLNRCRINLFAARQRNDTKAVENIERKIRIYEYTIEVLKNA
jgi:hypothetical protein